MFPKHRLRRRRYHPGIRELLRETRLHIKDFIYPLFVIEGETQQKPIDSMPGIYQHTLDSLLRECDECLHLGIRTILLFGIPLASKKDATGSIALREDNIIQKALRALKQRYGQELVLITDLCFCEYTNHGHCGILTNNELDNDATLNILRKQALSHAEHGSDIVAPSGMVDGMVQAIRNTLDTHHFQHIPIMSYAVKYASAYYTPFRNAVHTTLTQGNRRSYQMDPANRHEAYLEAEHDIREGADTLIIKPALPYLDIIRDLRTRYHYPLAAYQVSGEYAILKSATRAGYIEEAPLVLETLTSIKRAGADIIISYYTKTLAQWLKDSQFCL